MNALADHELLALLEDAAREGGEIALPYFRRGGRTGAAIDYKDEGSPVTEADIAVDRHLERRLRAALPDYGWLSEESVDDAARLAARRVVIVDPIDGTRGFIAGDDTWCVSIGVVEAGRPVAAALHAPARGETYAALFGRGATLNGARLPIRRAGDRALVHAGPHGIAQKLARPGETLLPHRAIPSLAYRLILLVRGEADIAAASKSCHDWDIAAADLILSESGFALRGLDGAAPLYNQPRPVHPALVAAENGRFADAP
jgi:myo-inositol-1(or 4)-monophosphatase